MSSAYLSKAIETLGYVGFTSVVVESLWKVPSRPEPEPTEFVEELWDKKLMDHKNLIHGRVYVITGTSSGLGKYLAEMILKRGGKVIMLNRKSKHSDQMYEDMKKLKLINESSESDQGVVNPDNVHLIDCDLCDFSSVRDAAKKVLNVTNEIDALVCNAGLMAQNDIRTVDGYDIQIQANHLSHYLLTALLFNRLVETGKKRGTPSRIVQHTSGARNSPDVMLSEDIFEKEWKPLVKSNENSTGKESKSDSEQDLVPNPLIGDDFGKWRRYQQSKRLNLGFTYALADYIDNHINESNLNTYIIATCAHPGATNSGLQSRTNASSYMDNLINGIAACAGQSVADGCQGLAMATLLMNDDDGNAIKNGSFFGPISFTGEAVLLESEREGRYESDDKDNVNSKKGQLAFIMEGSERCTGERIEYIKSCQIRDD